MAEAIVGGAFLSGFINVVFDRLLSPQVANLVKGKKFDQHLIERLKTSLCGAEALLIDAEQKQIRNPSVKNWIDSLRDAVYVADDLLDRVLTKAATQKEVSNFFPRFLNFQDREMVNKMEEIVTRIEDIEKRKYVLGLKETPWENLSWRTPSTSLVKGNIYGRENDQNAIIKMLNDNSEDEVSVIPIVGMGGVGKTTLAQWVYNNEELMKELEELGQEAKIKIHARHLSYGRLIHPISKNFDAIDELKSLRTFLQVNFSPPSFNFECAVSIILSKFKYLRVLSFYYCWDLDALPDSIGELIHLRYLDLSLTSIKALPESLGKLYNLQTLKLYLCEDLTMLPSGTQNLVNLRHLDIRGTVLKEMPRGMNKLKHLQLLSDFVVGEHEENGMKELGELSNLHGTLRIRKLENVTDCVEAGEARIMDKMHIEHLFLGCSPGSDLVTTSTHTEREIFDKLQPHKGLKVLTIKRYRGTRFPDWVGHSSYKNMTHLSLESCSNCCMLPSLGQLPSLKSLEIEDFNGVETIGAEFYKNDNDCFPLETPFPSLEYLSFRKMPCWEVWHSLEFDAFPQLKRLIIFDCPILTRGLPNHLPALKTLDIRSCPKLIGDLPNNLLALEILVIDGCEQLVSSIPRAPSIRELRISKSSKVGLQELPAKLQSLLIGGSEPVECMFQAITVSQVTCLQSLTISDCLSTISFPGNFLPECLKVLRLWNSEKLEFPKQLQQQKLLESLQICNSCNSLTSFPLEAFPNLKRLKISECKNLESLSVSQSALDDLPSEGLVASNMTDFKVSKCNKLKSFPCHMNSLLPKLECLSISDCPEIDSFPKGGLPPNLTSLEIRTCEKLLRSLSSMSRLQGLTNLIIGGETCESIKTFPKRGLLPQLPSLTTLELVGFETMETLDCKGLLHLTSLQVLIIKECPKLKNMVGETLPHSLIKLKIDTCALLGKQCQKKNIEIWPRISHIRGIQLFLGSARNVNLTSVDQSNAGDPFMESNMRNGCVSRGGLLPNLTLLEIRNCEKLVRCFASINLLESHQSGGPCKIVKSFLKESLLLQSPSLGFCIWRLQGPSPSNLA
ncbi:hypothetical protein VNO77_22735 [Canavalia gladiata]|uniref:Uncharacterized protein n=1 Tax=Canavalia gladiata TaxID=3824 RepID=A0AAN9QB24_CANGL